MSTPKLGNFPHFLDSRSWEKRIYIYNINMYMYIYIYTYVYYMILLYLEGSGSKFHSVNTKTSQFCQFFGVQELRKKHVNTKTSQFSTFLDSRSWEKHVCIYIYIICIYVHMYSTWFCYIWRVVVLSFIPSTPKLVNFANFLESRSWEKTCQHQN